MRFFKLIILLALCVPMRAANKTADLERSLITVEVTRKVYDFVQPWTRRSTQVNKLGTIVSNREILTTADFMADTTLIRLQKGGRGRWYPGKLEWIDYHANLAIIGSDDEDFWKDTKAVKLHEVTPRNGTAQIARWRAGNFESRNVDINRLVVKRGKLTSIDLLHLEVDTEISGVGWAEPVVKDGQLVGLCSSKEERSATIIPSSFIRNCLNERKKWRGLGFFAFVWQQAENPAILAYLKQKGDPRGVVISEVPTNEVTQLKVHDIILEVDGFAVDVKGDYKDPHYGMLSLENLATRRHWAGDDVKLKVMRDGKEMNVTYNLPKADYNVEVVPKQVFDREPEYALMGGLLFQPLTGPLLNAWGADWQRKAPFRLTHLSKQKATPKMPSAVILSAILPDPVNVGYQDARYLIVDSVNGRKVFNMAQLVEAAKHPVDGYHEIVFQKGESLRRIILDAKESAIADRRTQERYQILELQRINSTLASALQAAN